MTKNIFVDDLLMAPFLRLILLRFFLKTNEEEIGKKVTFSAVTGIQFEMIIFVFKLGHTKMSFSIEIH